MLSALDLPDPFSSMQTKTRHHNHWDQEKILYDYIVNISDFIDDRHCFDKYLRKLYQQFRKTT